MYGLCSQVRIAQRFQEPGYMYTYHSAQARGLNGAQLISTGPDGAKEVFARRFATSDLIGPPDGATGPLVGWTVLADYYLLTSEPYGPYADSSANGEFGNKRGFLGFTFDISDSEHWGWLEAEATR